MDAKVQTEPVGKTHKPCAFNPGGVNQDTCQSISRVVSKNRDGCTISQCRSPWRLCAACIVQNGEPNVVESAGERLCTFHKKHGEKAERSRQDTTSFSLSKYDPYDKPAKLHIVVTPITPTPKQAVVAKASEGRANILKPLPPIQGVESAEEGRAILERVRIAISNATYEIVDVKRIRPMPNQPRKYFNQERLLRLADSIKTVGQITPGYLRKVNLDAEKHDRELVDGERRWRSILMAGVSTFRAILVEVDEETAQYIVSVIANFNREGHTSLEIADSIRVMHEQLKLSMNEIAESIGFHPVYVTNLYGLRRLVPAVRAMLDPDLESARQLPVSAAIEIARLPQQYQESLARRVLLREVSLRTLRSEVVKVSEKHGIPIQRKTVDAFDQRRAIERKIDFFRRQAADLKGRLEETPLPVLAGWGTGKALEYRDDLKLARDDLDTSIKVFDRISKPQ